jgi:hypothetical protein
MAEAGTGVENRFSKIIFPKWSSTADEWLRMILWVTWELPSILATVD